MPAEVLSRVSTQMVLNGQTVAYTIYVLAIFSVMGWFAYRVTRTNPGDGVRPRWFWTFFVMLVIAGVSLHLLTHYTIPWKEVDIRSAEITPDQSFNIRVANHQFHFPADKLVIKKGQYVRFDVRSDDLTYGFGLFRPNNSMLFQMQVVPGHSNQIVWHFDEPGTFTVRSTEYSGPNGVDMIKKDAVVVTQ